MNCYLCGAKVDDITYSRQYTCERCFVMELDYFIDNYDETVFTIGGRQIFVGQMPENMAKYICMLHNSAKRK